MNKNNVLTIKSNPMVKTKFIDLYSDILLEIFAYLSFNDILNAFEGIMPSLWTLLIEGHLKFYINRSFSDASFWTQIFPRIDPLQLITLTIPYTDLHHLHLSPFYSSLRSITLENVLTDDREISIPMINQLFSLKRLKLRLSSTIVNEKNWLIQILRLSMIKQVQIESMQQKSTILPQKELLISMLPLRSSNISCLELRIPLRWTSIINLLSHFPRLKTFRAHLYPIKHHTDDTLASTPTLSCFETLEIVDLIGHFRHVAAIIDQFCLSIPHLRSCRLMANSVLADDFATILYHRDYFFGRRLFQFCTQLKQVKIHMLLPVPSTTESEREKIKDCVRAFNHEPLCQQYQFAINQRSILTGYVTLTCDYQEMTH